MSLDEASCRFEYHGNVLFSDPSSTGRRIVWSDVYMESDFLLEIGFFAPICRGLGVEYNCARSLSLKKTCGFSLSGLMSSVININ